MDCGFWKKCSCDLEYHMLYLKRSNVICRSEVTLFVYADWKESYRQNATKEAGQSFVKMQKSCGRD